MIIKANIEIVDVNIQKHYCIIRIIYKNSQIMAFDFGNYHDNIILEHIMNYTDSEGLFFLKDKDIRLVFDKNAIIGIGRPTEDRFILLDKIKSLRGTPEYSAEELQTAFT